MILVIDNYDSFVHNLARYFRQLGCETLVVRNDAVNLDTVKRLNPQAIVLSPGPCSPDQAGCSLELVATLHTTVPMFGVCLGHQTLVQALGGKVINSTNPVHGRSSIAIHTDSQLFDGIPKEFKVGRYHSLTTESIPDSLSVTAKTKDGLVMAVEHKTLPLAGVQFHPESVLTEFGYIILQNFLKIASISPTTSTEIPRIFV